MMNCRLFYRVCGLLVAALVLALVFQLPAESQASGFHINGRHLYDANGNRFIMRGISHAHTWYTNETSSFANIKAKGANAVRVVLSSGDRWTRNDASDVAQAREQMREAVSDREPPIQR